MTQEQLFHTRCHRRGLLRDEAGHVGGSEALRSSCLGSGPSGITGSLENRSHALSGPLQGWFKHRSQAPPTEPYRLL